MRRPLTARAAAVSGTLIAAAIGLAAAVSSFPLGTLAGHLPRGVPSEEDFLQHVIGQMYFLAQPWHWPLLEVTRLDPPHGVDIALTDSLPLVMVVLKLLHGLLPGIRQGVGPWLGLAWVMQPVAAVFALRGTGERRLWPMVVVAVMAASMPTFLFRIMHAALDGHFLLLTALGLYLRATRPGRHATWTASLAVLMLASLFIHPYLMAMVAAIAGAVPLTLAARVVTDGRGPGLAAWRLPAGCAGIVGTGAVLVVLAAWGFGYLQPGGPGGYGLYSMNLAAPLWPALSTLGAGLAFTAIDATGGQGEGFQYLGAGLIVLLAVLALDGACRDWVRAALRRHAGLALVMVVLTAAALSTHVFVFHRSLLWLHFIPPGGTSFRASGRLFWPVAYLLLLTGVRGVSVVLPRFGWLPLAIAAALQAYDATDLRRNVRAFEQAPDAPASPVLRQLRAILSHDTALHLRPRLECGVIDRVAALQAIYLAAQRDMPVNTMFEARAEPANACGVDPDAPPTLAPDVLGVAYGPLREASAALWQAYGATCGVLGPYTLCSARASDVAGLAPSPAPAPLPPGQTVTASRPELFGAALARGWYMIAPWGVWSGSSRPQLRLRLPAPVRDTDGSVRLTLVMRAPPGVAHHDVTVVEGPDQAGAVLARWTLTQTDQAYHLTVGPKQYQAGQGSADATLVLTLLDGTTASVPGDRHRFGIGLVSLRLDPVPP